MLAEVKTAAYSYKLTAPCVKPDEKKEYWPAE